MGKFTSAVILAAGNGTRFGGKVKKQFVEVLGVPCVVRTVQAFEDCPLIDEIILVGDPQALSEIFSAYSFKKIAKIISGGETRQDSALRGFDCVSDKSRYVAIHDAARCLVTPEIIDRVCAAAVKYSAATAATRCTDTVKISGKNKFVDHTENRDHVWLAQTPQVFLCDLYRAASYIAEESHIDPTDDNALIENVNHKVRLVECGKYNMKITTPEDLVVACSIFKAREAFPPTLPEDKDKDEE